MRWHNLLVPIIRQGQASGELRADTEPQLIESLLSSVYMTTLVYWTCCPNTVEPAMDFALLDGVRARLTLVLDGIATKGGRP